MDRYKDCTSAQTNLVRAEVTIPLASGMVLQPSVAGIKPKNTPAGCADRRMERDPGRAGRSRALITGSELRPN